ncbi:Ribosomal small subunit pseudouridine synthase A [gamma proteobacterium HdN1]|nr:Ribosomal small subunit pseudouridine synthase A [gamma proteobacterium HdN1]
MTAPSHSKTPNQERQRLDRFLSQSGRLSRSMARKAILAGEVTINGTLCRDASTKIGPNDTVHHHHDIVVAPSHHYLMLHKPEGVVCATEDGRHRTVIDLLGEPWRSDLHIAGRLDIDTTGLVLLTSDGDWSHRVTSPRHNKAKRYHVTTADPIASSWCASFEQGVMLDGETKLTRPAQLEILDEFHANLCLQEGRYHQVKRMFAAMGTRVVKLHRYAIGELILDNTLPLGHYRALTDCEIQRLADHSA